MKKTLTKASSKKSSKRKSPAKPAKRSMKAKARPPRPIKYITKKNGELETKEEREKRLARRAALTLRAFQMFYEDYHNQNK